MPAVIAAAATATAAVAASVLAILLYPIAHHLALPPDYPGRATAHPTSPHTPPRFPLPADDTASFRRDGFVVLRGILPAELAANMVVAGDDLLANRTRHCELTKLTGPPIFHGYDRYCGRAHLIHDYLRDIVYQSPLAHVASQLLLSSSSSENEPQQQPIVRLWADVFMAGAKLPKRWHSDFLSFSKFARRDKTTNAAVVNCQQGLVFWMPLKTSNAERNGLLLYNQSSTHFADYFRDHPNRAHNFFSYWQWLQRHRPQDDNNDVNVVAPTLELSDVIAFDACCLHTSSGKYPTGKAGGGQGGGGMLMRRAYQLRFMTDFELNPSAAASSSSSTTGSWWQRLLFPMAPILPVASPQLWPHTLAEEDAIRAAGHVIYTKTDWVRRLTRGPVYTLLSCALALRTRLWGDAGESASSVL
jgi:Phytanoyl-CoA dioxygenase (PhyH)